MDTLNNMVHKSELSDLIFDLSNPQLKYGFLLLNGQPIEANLAYKYIYSTVKIVMKWTSILYENLSCMDWNI